MVRASRNAKTRGSDARWLTISQTSGDQPALRRLCLINYCRNQYRKHGSTSGHTIPLCGHVLGPAVHVE